MFENEHEQGWNHMHAEQPYANLARSSTIEHGSCPVENMSVDAVSYSSPWNPVPMSSSFATSSHNVQAPRYQPDSSGPSHDLFLHPSVPGTFGAAPENYMHHASSSNYDKQTFHGVEGGFVDLTMGSGRGPHKRKSPGVPSVCEKGGSSRYASAGSSSDRQTFHGTEGGFVDLTMGSGRGPHKRKSPGVPSVCEKGGSSRYASAGSSSDRQTFHGIGGGFVDLTMGSGRGPHKRKSPGVPSVCEKGGSSRYASAGSSSDIPVPSDFWQEKPNIDPQHMLWDHVAMPASCRGSGLSIRCDGSIRNVRSRPALDLERTHLSSNSSHTSYPTNQSVEHSNSVDISCQNSNAVSREWGHLRMSPTHGRILPEDSNVFNQINRFLGGSATNASLEVNGLQHDSISGRNPVPQGFHNNLAQPVRGVRTNYSQRSGSTFRASSSSVRLGHAADSEEGMQVASESNSSRHPRSLSAVTWRNNERNGRSRISHDRYRSLADDAAFHGRFPSEGFMIGDRSAFYGSRNMFDQHRDMRLDIDNLTYEELLALGERIGSVNTGLSEDSISKCLAEAICHSSDQYQDGSSCVICLEDYEDMDEVGALKTCGHKYHAPCIKKWLLMKNTCPICKASVLTDDMKEK
ncbi:hypothetical protein V6N13_096999 [Hibiscus sabdariffa]|uniref:Uncharacterized protein n=2 Tax=Hibiscus sabdariffa TaxID=183260 RepID=A0ABR1ZRJ6_9ROSI